ncbi:MAG: MFS transporter [Deferrisomatales bacterium]
MVLFTLIGAASAAGLWFIRPSPHWTVPALFLLGLGSVSSELAGVFYNAMLPALAPRHRIGRWSGWGWSMGYLGGMGCLLAALLLFLGTDPWIALVGLTALGTAALLAASPMQFWVVAILLGFFVGPAQSASRSYLSRTAPEDLRNELFGLYALSGKVVSFLGPLLVGWVTARTGSQRAGMAVVVALFLAGLLLLLRVPRAAEVRDRN